MCICSGDVNTLLYVITWLLALFPNWLWMYVVSTTTTIFFTLLFLNPVFNFHFQSYVLKPNIIILFWSLCELFKPVSPHSTMWSYLFFCFTFSEELREEKNIENQRSWLWNIFVTNHRISLAFDNSLVHDIVFLKQPALRESKWLTTRNKSSSQQLPWGQRRQKHTSLVSTSFPCIAERRVHAPATVQKMVASGWYPLCRCNIALLQFTGQRSGVK